MQSKPKGLSDRQIEYLRTVPVTKRGVLQKSLEGKSRAAAIKSKCFDCVGFEDMTTRIRECATEICPLWPYRPFQNGNDEVDAND